jgi:hypothetical protein
MLKPEERQKIFEDVECEGFMYAFYNYSDYEEIKDKNFHYLRKSLINAAQKLADYCYIPRNMI